MDRNGDADALDPNASGTASRLERRFGGLLIAATGFTRGSAAGAIEGGAVDAVAFGRLSIADPELPERFRLGAPPNRYDRPTLHGGRRARRHRRPRAGGVTLVHGWSHQRVEFLGRFRRRWQGRERFRRADADGVGGVGGLDQARKAA